MTSTPWLPVAWEELGVAEVPGPAANQRITEYHQTTTLGAVSDEVAWCSAFMCWCMEQCGITHTNSARARSWLQWGTARLVPEPGDIVVLKRGASDAGPEVTDAQGHVGLYLGLTWLAGEPAILVLGGNQSNRVSIAPYQLTKVLGFRTA